MTATRFTTVAGPAKSGIVPRMGKKTKIALSTVVGIIVLAGVVLHLSRERLVRAVAIGLIEDITGFGVELGDLRVDLRRRTLAFTDLKLLNPKPFVEPDGVHISRIFAVLSWEALLGRRTWLPRLDIEIASLNLIRPREGLSNLEVMSKNAEAWDAAQQDEKPPPEARAPAPVATAGWGIARRPRQVAVPAGSPSADPDARPDLQIDELRIRIGSVQVIDYKLGRFEPVRFTSELNLEKTYHDVTDLDALGEEIAIDFGVDTLLGQFGDLEKSFPGISDEVKNFLRELNDPDSEEAQQMKDAVNQFQHALDGVAK